MHKWLTLNMLSKGLPAMHTIFAKCIRNEPFLARTIIFCAKCTFLWKSTLTLCLRSHSSIVYTVSLAGDVVDSRFV